MATDIGAAMSAPPSSTSLLAAREHVQRLSARDRESLLRALLEQYEQPTARYSAGLPDHLESLDEQTAEPQPPEEPALEATDAAETMQIEQRRQGAPLSRPHDVSGGLGGLGDRDCKHKMTDCHADSVEAPKRPQSRLEPAVRPSSTHGILVSALTRAKLDTQDSQLTHSASLSSSTSSPLPVSHFRTSSVSHPFMSSITRLTSRPRNSHKRTRSLPSADSPKPATTGTSAASSPTPTSPAVSSAGSRSPSVSATVRLSSTRAYWCTVCGEKFRRREDWIKHDVACRCSANDTEENGYQHGRKRQQQQRAWACGFCAGFLRSLERYHDHVALHFEGGKTLAHWHYANVIYGLLHQPVLHEAWNRIWAARVAALPAQVRPKATWFPESDEPSSAASEPSLQDMLEVFDPDEQSAEALAARAEDLAVFVVIPVDNGSATASSTAAIAEPVPPKDEKPSTDLRPQEPKPKPKPKDEPSASTKPSSSAPTAPPAPSKPQHRKIRKNRPQSPPVHSLVLFPHRSSHHSKPTEKLSTKSNSTPDKHSQRENDPTPSPRTSPTNHSQKRFSNFSHWADRPLPPLARISSSNSLPLTPTTKARLRSQGVDTVELHSENAAPRVLNTPHHLSVDQPNDWNSVATTMVDDIPQTHISRIPAQ